MTKDQKGSTTKLKLLAMGGAAALALLASASTAGAECIRYGPTGPFGTQLKCVETKAQGLNRLRTEQQDIELGRTSKLKRPKINARDFTK